LDLFFYLFAFFKENVNEKRKKESMFSKSFIALQLTAVYMTKMTLPKIQSNEKKQPRGSYEMMRT
jgi:hypothetical protein